MRLAATQQLVIIHSITIMLLLCAKRVVPRASAAFTTSLLQHNIFADAASHHPQCRSFAGLSHHQKKKRKLVEQRRRSDAKSEPQMKSGPKKILNRPALLRADRVLSNRGWASRKACFELLKQKRVTTTRRDHGEDVVVTVQGPSDRLSVDAALWVDGRVVPAIPLLLAYHKPKWVLSVMSDPLNRPCLNTVLPPHYQQQELHPVGRLDYDTSGLLLFSSNGGLTQKLLHPSHEVPKQYVAIVEDAVDEQKLREHLEKGVETAEGIHTAELVDVTLLSADESQAVWQQMRQTLPPEYNVTDLEERGYLPKDESTAPTKLLSQVRIVVREGKHRMVRRMLANCGHGVVELKREQQGEIVLEDDLAPSEFRNLTEAEEEWAQSMVPTKKKGKK